MRSGNVVFMRVLAALAAALVAGCATQRTPEARPATTAAPIAAVQAPKPGDQWVYQGWNSGQPDRRREQVIRVKSVDAARIVETRSLPGGRVVETVHEAGAYVGGFGNPGFFGFAPYLPVFQRVAPDDAWRALPFHGLGPCNANPNWDCRFEARVAGAERITVAAGSFDTLRVEVEQTVSVYSRGPRPWLAQRKATFWYAPAAKRYVKTNWQTVGGPWRGPDGGSELASYKLN